MNDKIEHKSCCLANSRDKLVLNLHKSQNRENDLKNLLTKYKNRKNGWAKIKRKTFSSIFDVFELNIKNLIKT